MTIHNKDVVFRILANAGYDPDESQWFYPFIYSYKSPSNENSFALFTDANYDDMDQSPFVSNVVCLMANGIITKEGNSFLRDLNEENR